MIVISPRLLQFRFLDKPLFLRPALIDTFEAPLGALVGCANRHAIHQHKNRIGMRRRLNAQGDPTALSDVGFELNRANFAIRVDRRFRDGKSVYD